MKKRCSPMRRLLPLAVLMLSSAAFAQNDDVLREGAVAAPRGFSVEIDEAGTTLTQPAAPIADAPTTTTLELLGALEKRHAGVRTVRGDFQQRLYSEVFLEETWSSGRFWFEKPDRYRCDFDPPDRQTILVLEDRIYIYTPALEQADLYRFESREERDRQLHTMLVGFGFDADAIVRDYGVRTSEDAGDLAAELEAEEGDPEETALMELTPRPAIQSSSPFVRLKVWIDKSDLLPEKIRFVDYNGDETTIMIEKLELNVPIEDKIFDPDFPRGTEIIDKASFQR